MYQELKYKKLSVESVESVESSLLNRNMDDVLLSEDNLSGVKRGLSR